jgi:outer membrane protein
MKRQAVLALLAAMVCQNTLQAQTWSLTQCIDHALAHSITVKQSDNSLKKQSVQLSTARNQRLPDLSASASENVSFGRGLTSDNTYSRRNTATTSFSLNTSVPIFTGFRIPNNVRINRLNLLAAVADLEKAKNDIRVQVAQAYVQILYDMEISDVAHRQVSIDSVQVARLQALLDVGKASQVQLSQQKATLAKSQLTATQADNKRHLSLLALTQLLELPSPEGFSIVRPEVQDSVADESALTPDMIYYEAASFRPEIEAQNLRLNAANRNIAVAKAPLYPQLSFSAGLGSSYYDTSGKPDDDFGMQLRNNFSQHVGLSLTYSIFNRFQTRNAIRSARIDYQNQMLALEKTKKTLYKEIQQAYYNMVAAQQKLHSSSQARHSAADAFQLMSAKYELGNATITEFNESKNTYLKAESDLTQARYEYLFQHALILFYRGKELKF